MGYDGSAIIVALSDMGLPITVVPKSKSRFISISTFIEAGYNLETDKKIQVEVRFIDSFRFLNMSLLKLAETVDSLPKTEQFVKSTFKDENALEYFKLSKMHFPYEFIKSFRHYEMGLPSIDGFFSTLTGATISQDEYDYCLNIYTRLAGVNGGLMNLGIFNMFYQSIDIHLLHDVFENFRKTSYDAFGLDPVHFYSLPNFSFEILKFNVKDMEIPIPNCPTFHQFIRKNLKGGLSMASRRESVSNIPRQKHYDPSKPLSSIHYFDQNSQYPTCMFKYKLPFDEYRWLEGSEFKAMSIVLKDYQMSCELFNIDSDYSCILQCDVLVPSTREAHDFLNTLPLLPTNEIINKTKRLIPTLYPLKKDFVGHVLLLQQSQKFGYQIVKVHRILLFRQTYWLRDHMSMLSTMRINATSTFSKLSFKMYMNATFGKLLQRNRELELKCVSKWVVKTGKGNWAYAERYLKQPIFRSFEIINSNLAIIEMCRTNVELTSLVVAGMSVLDISKTLLYSFFYDEIRPVYGLQATVNYVDTDGIIFSLIQNLDPVAHSSNTSPVTKPLMPCFHHFMKCRGDLFDTSNYPFPNRFNMPLLNKGQLGYWKDESEGKTIIYCCCLGSKVYAIEVEDCDRNEKILKLKGVAKRITKLFEPQDYRNVLYNRLVLRNSMSRICTKNQVNYTVVYNRISLNHINSKRMIVGGDVVNTYAFGHYKTLEMEH